MQEGNKKEKLEFLKREEIRTMQKDIKMLREIEAEKERERIAAMAAKAKRIEVKPKPKIEVKPKPKIEPLVKETLIPRPPKKPSPFQKFLVRVAFVILCLLIISFFYWFFWIKTPKEKIPPIIPPVKKEIIIPPPLISVDTTRISEISKTEAIPGVFNQLLKEELVQGSFTRLVIKNISESRLVSLKELSEAFQIDTPQEIFQKLEEDYILSIYSQKEGKRIALVGKTKDNEELNELLKNWEEKISKEGVFISGKKILTLVPYFKTASYQNVDFRYLTISTDDFGICYVLLDDYFVLTTSSESIQKVIGKIKWLEGKIGQLFIIGFEGKSLTPQLKEFFKKYKPGGILLLSKNIENREQLKNLISDLQDLSLNETGLPLFIAVDQEGEPLSRIGFLEEKTPQSEIKNTEEAYQIGLRRGKELKELGINLNLAPVLDLMKEGDFYFNRTFQKPVKETGELAKSLILGQKAAGILTVIKHFPGYVGIPFNPENMLAAASLPEISQFKKAMEANPEFVMSANVIYNEIDSSLPFTFSPAGIQFLKVNLGNQILVIADDLDQNSLLKKFSLNETVAKPVQVGVDILIFSGYRLPVEQGLDGFLKAFENGEVSKQKVEEAISRITQLKKDLLLK